MDRLVLVSGHHKFSELVKDFSPERKRAIKANTTKTLAELRAQGGYHLVEGGDMTDCKVRHRCGL